MLLTKDHNHGDYEIRSYQVGEIKINDQTYSKSLIVGAHQLENWTPQCFQQLTPQDFEKILDFKPNIVLVGTGEKLLFPEAKLLRSLYEHQVGVEIMATHAACRTFNVLMSEGRNVVAALLIL
ncbi:MAG: Mth938-like domain-containing protein [Gammaproteobacteria bacterium]|nr:Mth938-like domain-containing protein [Gammaproteobacteria bacterium]